MHLVFVAGAILTMLSSSVMARPAATVQRTLTIDDVLGMQHLDRAVLSPDGEWVAAVVQRPASRGEVYGRAPYEIDPSRDDVWLISTNSGVRRAVTDGARAAAGFWCATWSPDGQRLAMLSTQPEQGEPRGGDNVHLYVWDRATGAVVRAASDPLMTQTRYGSGLNTLDLRGGADHGSIAHTCIARVENAPFLWLDGHRLLAVTQGKGQLSGLFDQYLRPYREKARDAARLHDGLEPTVSEDDSGAAVRPDRGRNTAILKVIDLDSRNASTIAEVPVYPFRGALTVAVSPDGKHLALLPTLGALPPQAGHSFPNFTDDAWIVEHRMGLVDLAAGSAIRWIAMPAQSRFPLELLAWSPDSSRIALRGRSAPDAPDASLFVVAARDGVVTQLGATPLDAIGASPDDQGSRPVMWADDEHVLARLRGRGPEAPANWWLLGTNDTAVQITRPGDAMPIFFRHARAGRLIGATDHGLVMLDRATNTLSPLGSVLPGTDLIGAEDPERPIQNLLLSTSAAGEVQTIGTYSPETGHLQATVAIPSEATVMDVGSDGSTIVWSEGTQRGLFLHASIDGIDRPLLALDTQLADIAWGKTQLIDYTTRNGEALKAAIILPPDYHPGRRYPTLLWVYAGYRVRSLAGEYWLDPFLPGIYNLQLYAAQGYVVMIPSMPLEQWGERSDVYSKLTLGVLPAIDKLVALGIADPDRLGVMGQSFGGYSVYGLISQTHRFKAAVAMAGITDLTSNYGQFDALAHGYFGIDHEMSDNPRESYIFGMQTPSGDDPAGYARNSPLTYVNQVDTPLLMIHGDLDMRGDVADAEKFFSGLYAQGKTARLLRYGGESHSLAQSPANVRDIFAQTSGWLATYLKQQAAASPTKAGPVR